MEAVPMSHYLQSQLYEIISSFDLEIGSFKDFLIRLNLYNFEPNLSVIIEDFSGVLGYYLVGITGNQAFVINYGFRHISSFDAASIFLSFINEQMKYYPKLKIIRIIVSKESALLDYLEKNGFFCQRTFKSYELGHQRLDWKENYDIRLVKERITVSGIQKIRMKEEESILVPSCFSDDEIVCTNEYFGVYEGKGKQCKIGYLCANEIGEIKQLFIIPSKRRNAYASTVIKNYYYQFTKWAKLPIRFRYIDASYEPMNKLLRKLGFRVYSSGDNDLVKYFT